MPSICQRLSYLFLQHELFSWSPHFNCLLDTSIWMFDRRLVYKHVQGQAPDAHIPYQHPSPTLKLAPLAIFPISVNDNSILVAQAKNSGVNLDSYLSLTCYRLTFKINTITYNKLLLSNIKGTNYQYTQHEWILKALCWAKIKPDKR